MIAPTALAMSVDSAMRARLASEPWHVWRQHVTSGVIVSHIGPHRVTIIQKKDADRATNALTDRYAGWIMCGHDSAGEFRRYQGDRVESQPRSLRMQ